MGAEKWNSFLDVDESEDDSSQGYDSEAAEFRKGGRSVKRRKVDAESDVSEEENDSEDVESEAEAHIRDAEEEATTAEARVGGAERQEEAQKATTPKQLKRRNLVASEEAVRKSGVVYLSRVPPFMRPRKLRSLLEPYGKINRTYLAEEDAAARARRVKAGGSRKRFYTEGWVEFVDKRDAKAACELLNARTVGGKKGGYYHDSIWNLLYLKGFKWHHLTEQIAAENAARESRMRAEISKANKENHEFVRNVERARMLDGMEAKAAIKRGKGKGGDGGEGGEEKRPAKDGVRTFKQIPIARRQGETNGRPSEAVTRVLGSIF